jgi:hypothetical protein
VTPHPCDMSDGILKFRHFAPEELTSLQFVESVEDCKPSRRASKRSRSTEKVSSSASTARISPLELLAFPGPLDLRVQRRQFLL